jgi:CRP-like cAMP-binding protein
MASAGSRGRDLTDRLLAGVDANVQRTIIAEGARRKLSAGQVLYRMDEPAEQLYVLLKGRVQLSRPVRSGHEVLVRVLVPGDVFGLVCLLTSARHEALIDASAPERLARALSDLGVQGGTRSPDGIDIRIKNEQLAALADVSAFTASRQLQQWEREGAVKKRRGAVRIVDPDGLLPH